MTTIMHKLLEKIHRHESAVLNLSNHSLTDYQIKPIIEEITMNPSIEVLDLSFNRLGNASTVAIASLTQLKSLDLGANCIGNKGLTAFQQHPSIEALGLNFNMNIDEYAVMDLIVKSRLRDIQLIACQISEEGKKSIEALLNKRRNYRSR